MNTHYINIPALTTEQFDAVLAGLRLLAQSLADGSVLPDDGNIGEILTNGGDHAGLSVDAIQDLGDNINGHVQS